MVVLWFSIAAVTAAASAQREAVLWLPCQPRENKCAAVPTGDECLSPRVCLECNPEIPVAPGVEHWLLDTSLDEVLRADIALLLLALSLVVF